MASPFEEKEVELTAEQKELHAKVEKYEVRVVISVVAIASHPLSAAFPALEYRPVETAAPYQGPRCYTHPPCMGVPIRRV